MKRTALAITLVLTILVPVLAGIVHFGTVQASTELTSILKPSVPEFTVELVDSSYDVPTTYSIDPYTGENVTHLGHRVEKKSIEVKIKNQPFTPYEIQENENNWTINFYYNIRIKGHFSEDWSELYRASDGYPTQSDSQYSIISYVLGGDADTILGTKMIKLPAGAQVDFQVEAMIGYVHREISIPVPGTGWIFTGETSGWSETRTITIPASTPSPTDSPTPDQTPTPTPDQEPQQTELLQVILAVALIVAVVCVGLGLLIYLIKRD